MPDSPRETPTETTAYQEAVETMARADAEHQFSRWSQTNDGWVSQCVCDAEVQAIDWRVDGPVRQREHRMAAVLDAFLARPGPALKVLEEAGAVVQWSPHEHRYVHVWYCEPPRVSDPTEGP